MTKVLIYNFSGELDDISHLFPNERLARITAIARKQQCEVDLIDRANYQDLHRFGKEFLLDLSELAFEETNPRYEAKLHIEAEFLLAQSYDIIFLNLWHGTGFKFSMDLAFFLKQACPNIRIYGVGQKVDWFTGHILLLSRNTLDGVITGLGYNAIEAVLAGHSFAECPNTISCQHGITVITPKEVLDVDRYPTGIYDPDVYHGIQYKLPFHTITLSNQACPNHCVFCVRPENYGQLNIERQTHLVLEEMRVSFFQYGISYFRFEDSTPPEGALTRLAHAILASDIAGKVYFTAFSRIDTNSVEDFHLLHQAGCISLFFGVESLADENLLRLQKGITYEEVRTTLQLAHNAEIRTVCSFIVPIPGETTTSLETTIARIKENREYIDAVLSLPGGVYPQTEWGRNPDAYNIILDDDYIVKLITYPIRYLFPMQYWPPFPFKYPVLGKPAVEVTLADILSVLQTFQQAVQQDLRIPPIQDYLFLLANYLHEKPEVVTQQVVHLMVTRNYLGVGELLQQHVTV